MVCALFVIVTGSCALLVGMENTREENCVRAPLFTFTDVHTGIAQAQHTLRLVSTKLPVPSDTPGRCFFAPSVTTQA